MANPLAFRPTQVTIWTSIVYLALLIPLVILNETVPKAPSSPTPYPGINLTEAWLDLATLTQGYHPYNSHKNDEVRNWLLLRIQQILEENGADWDTEISTSKALEPSHHLAKVSRSSGTVHEETSHGVTVFNDLSSNVTMSFSGQPGSPASSVAAYFEGTNVLVYIRGSEDEKGEWWRTRSNRRKLPIGGGGVMVNAHYDSVSTGFGATDDGMGVITVLQLIKYFTTSGQQPKHGIVALLNNGEEDFLYGARAFGNSPLMPFVHTFLNLEGAGAGGRALLFRGTDQQVVGAYSKTSHPLSSVITADAFGMGVIKSQTDYVVFDGVYGQRGLDLAFFKPRSRYHTHDDDIKHTSRASLWHMLSASVDTMRDLSSTKFVGNRADGDANKVPNGRGSDGVWFDLFGSSLVLFNLRGMFAWSLTLLIATPLILMLLTYLATKKGKYYFFRNRVNIYDHDGPPSGDYERVKVGGLRGLIRFPFAVSVSSALVLGGAFLLRKENPFIVHGSKYTVWAMFVSIAYFSFWCIMRGADAARSSALHRGYVNIWLFAIGWAVLVVITVLEDRFQIASGYYVVFLNSALFLTTLISLSEQFALPDITTWGQEIRDDHETFEADDANIIAPSPGEYDGPASDNDDADDEGDREPANANTPLLGRTSRDGGERRRTTFATTYRNSIAALTDTAANVSASSSKRKHNKDSGAFGNEQPWSKDLPTWTWLVQFLIMGPFLIILAAQTGLILTDATNQTGTDGSNPILPYLIIAFFSMLLILPLMPFMHRITHHIPLFLLCIFVATLVYNLVAFPFSANAKYKAFWMQTVNLDTGASDVKLGGIEDYLRLIIAELPSAAGKGIACHDSTTRAGIADCVYDGTDIPPNVADNIIDGVPPLTGYADLVTLKVAPGDEPGRAKLTVDAKNTKSCFLKFARPIKRFAVAGSNGWDDRFGRMPHSGLGHILLWRREWDTPWEVDVEWDVEGAAHKTEMDDDKANRQEAMSETDELKARSAGGLDGNVTCIWSDINSPGTIPALDEAIQYAPAWAVITKFAAGLVEGTKSFMI